MKKALYLGLCLALLGFTDSGFGESYSSDYYSDYTHSSGGSASGSDSSYSSSNTSSESYNSAESSGESSSSSGSASGGQTSSGSSSTSPSQVSSRFVVCKMSGYKYDTITVPEDGEIDGQVESYFQSAGMFVYGVANEGRCGMGSGEHSEDFFYRVFGFWTSGPLPSDYTWAVDTVEEVSVHDIYDDAEDEAEQLNQNATAQDHLAHNISQLQAVIHRINERIAGYANLVAAMTPPSDPLMIETFRHYFTLYQEYIQRWTQERDALQDKLDRLRNQ